MNYAIAKELKVIRVKKELRMEDVAKDNDIAYETLRKYEKDAINISIGFLIKLLLYYKIPLSIFFENVCANMHEYNQKETDA